MSNDIGRVFGNAFQVGINNGGVHVYNLPADSEILRSIAERREQALLSLNGLAVEILPRTGRTGQRAACVGRTRHLTELRQRLSAGFHVLICGPAGVGKTALLHQAANDGVLSAATVTECEDVLWQPARGLSPEDVLRELAMACSRPPSSVAIPILRGIRVLVVLDDVDWSPTQMDDVLTAMPRSVFVVASRSTELAALLRPLPVGGLSAAEATELLENELGDPLSEAEARHVVLLRDSCDGNPGNLVQIGAAAYLARDRGGIFESLSVEVARLAVPRLLDNAGHALPLVSTLLIFPDLTWGGELLRGLRSSGTDETDLLVRIGLVVGQSGRYRAAHNIVDSVSPPTDNDAREVFDRMTKWLAMTATPAQVFAELALVESALRQLLDDGRYQAAVVLARVVSAKLLPSLWWDRGDRVLKLGLVAARRNNSRPDELYFGRALTLRRAADRQLDEAFSLMTAAAANVGRISGSTAYSGPGLSTGTRSAGVNDLTGPGSGGAGASARQTVTDAAARFMSTPAMVNIAGIVHNAPSLARVAAVAATVVVVGGTIFLGSQPGIERSDPAAATTATTKSPNPSLPSTPGNTGSPASPGTETTAAARRLRSPTSHRRSAFRRPTRALRRAPPSPSRDRAWSRTPVSTSRTDPDKRRSQEVRREGHGWQICGGRLAGPQQFLRGHHDHRTASQHRA
ncbi:MAG TPA: hypothetical protein VNO31_36485, partial [Umezawaea sp.]|nr:hypothetical protein [Umezawaea sp.]